MRLLICAGGTGGGVYPALAVVEALRLKTEGSKLKDGEQAANRKPSTFNLSTVWVGAQGGVEADLVGRAGVPFESIHAAGVHGVGLRALPGNLWQLGRGLFEARRILHRQRPEALLFTGGYVAVPVALASRRILGRSTPIVLFVPDIEPGLALNLLARFADRIAVSVEESREKFPHPERVVVTGYPTRTGLKALDLDQARKVFDLSAELPTLLVMGGSSGAQGINRALMPALPALLAEMQVIHLSGQIDWHEVEAFRSRLAPELGARYRPFPYLHAEMGAALSLADLVVSRAGASILGELPLFGLPAVLVPYPHAWQYQKTNADYLARRGAAVVVPEPELPARLLPLAQELLRSPERRGQMRQAMQSLRRPDAAQAIANLVLETAKEAAR